MIYQCRHFKIFELVDQRTYDLYGETAWMFFPDESKRMIDGIRDYFSMLAGKDVPVTINNWHFNGTHQWRGLRTIEFTGGAVRSFHRLAAAFDMDIEGVPAHEARREILANQDHEYLQYITCMEDRVSWLHVDRRNIPDRIKIIRP
jgi:hypothetical protein